MSRNEQDAKRLATLLARKKHTPSKLEEADRSGWLFRWVHIPIVTGVRPGLAKTLGLKEDEVPDSFKMVAFSPYGIDESWAYLTIERAESNPLLDLMGLPQDNQFVLRPVSIMADDLCRLNDGTYSADDLVKEKVLDPAVARILFRACHWNCGAVGCDARHVGRCMAVRVGVPTGDVIATVVEASLSGPRVAQVSPSALTPITF